MPNGLSFVEVKVWYTSAKKYVHYQITYIHTKFVGKVALQSCPKCSK
jgi:hypothetical protein